MPELIAGAIIILVCVACEGFFSGTETAMVSIDRSRIKALAEKGSRRAAMIDAMMDRPEKFFSTTLLGTNLSVVLSNAVATLMVITCLGEQFEYVTILIMTPLILIFGEIVPKTIYRYHADSIAMAVIFPLKLISTAFSPLVLVLSWITNLFVKPFGLRSSELKPHTTREDLENYLDMWNIDSSLRTAEKKMIERIFNFADTDVDDIMIRLVNIEALELQDSIAGAVSLARKTGYSRIPVYAGEAYNIVGIIHAHDLLSALGKAQSLKEVMRPARYVPNTMPIDELLKQMRTEGDSIAVVVNEYGGTIGIVTIEDILEEVVGEIYDEHDKQESLIVRVGRSTYQVNARVEIDEINESLGLKIPKDDYETVAGFLLKHMERIPRPGEVFQFEGLKFSIRQADRRAIRQVNITLPEREVKPAEGPKTGGD